MPCELSGECFLPEPSPGFEGRLLPENYRAAHFWTRWEILGDRIFDLYPLHVEEEEAHLFVEKLYTLKTHKAAIDKARREQEEAQRRGNS